MNAPILPGAMLGIVGGGQLGRMFATTARRMGYGVAVLDPDPSAPAAQVANFSIQANYDDIDALTDLSRKVSALTLEFENVSAQSLEYVGQYLPVRPGPKVLKIAQNRLSEKSFFVQHGFPVVRHAAVHSQQELQEALAGVGFPAILKTVTAGYDGKGQSRIAAAADADTAWERIGSQDAILEKAESLRCELSVLVARNSRSEIALYGPIQNEHRNHILDLSFAPAAVSVQLGRAAVEIARDLAQRLDLVGLICVEFFVTEDNRLLVNEIAPRPHNSGHLTIEACVCSQFEQQVRCLCNLPLGPSELLQPAAMVNLLGNLWNRGEPDWMRVLEMPAVQLHLYGKHEALSGRKMGHVTTLATNAELAASRVRAAVAALSQANYSSCPSSGNVKQPHNELRDATRVPCTSP
jgi:5-(carboxyamino)imidazole ribonucleotide synthase